MQHSVPKQSFRSLLYVEWILLFVTASIEVFLHLYNPDRPAPWIVVGVNLVFAGLGLLGRGTNTTLNAPWHKIALTALELSLILLAGNISGRRAGNFVAMLSTITVIRACFRFGQRGRSIVAGLAVAAFLIVLQTRPIRRMGGLDVVDHQWLFEQLATKFYVALSFGLTLLIILLLVNTLMAERQNRQELDIVNQQLRRYALQIEDQATVQERNRIAREIHDALGHTLTAQSILLQNTQVFLQSDPPKAAEFLTESMILGNKALQDVRQSVASLRTNPLQSMGLPTALHQLIDNFQQTSHISPLYTTELPKALPPEIGLALYRILQEALTNIQKHAQATQVKVDIQATKTQAKLVIEDNGKGFDPRESVTGFGLQGMRERTQNLAGTLRIASQVGGGCCITAELPLLGHNV